MRVKIFGKSWVVRVLSDKVFFKKFGDAEAITDCVPERKIFFSKKGLKLDTIKHEIFHAFLSELCVGSAFLDPDQTEEVGAELFGQHSEEMIKVSSEIFEKLK